MEIAAGAGALARAGRDRRHRRHGALHRQLDRTLQVKLTTPDPDRYIVTCNGRRVPLQKTDTGGVASAGALQGLAAGDGAASGACRSMRR
jgi:hypothetical protein